MSNNQRKKELFLKRFIRVISLLFTILIFTGCSTDKKADSSVSTTKTESSSTVSKKKKAEEEKAKEEVKLKEAEKKKQEEISKKVLEADTAMKVAEANPTDETITTAKSAIEAIPGGNVDLSKRLETATASLEAIKQQTAAQVQPFAEQTQQVQQEPQQAPAPQTEQPQVSATQQAEIDRQPTIETDENGRTYIFENHNAYKDEPYYTEDWMNNPSPYQDQ